MANDIKTNEAENLKTIIKKHIPTGILFWKSHGDILLEKIKNLQTIPALLNQVKLANISLKPKLITAILDWLKLATIIFFIPLRFPIV